MAEDNNLTTNVKSIMKSFPELRDMTEDQIAAMVSILIRTRENVEKTKVRFEKLAEKKVSLETINKIRILYKEQIQEGILKRAQDLSDLPLGSARKQLRELKKIFDYAMDNTIVRGQRKIDSQNYEDYTDIDARLAKETVLAADTIISKCEARKIDLLKEKNKLKIALGKSKKGEGEQEEEGEVVEEEDDEIYEVG